MEMEQLSGDVLVHVFKYLSARDIALSCALVSKEWLDESRNQSLWRLLCERDYTYSVGDSEDAIAAYIANGTASTCSPHSRALIVCCVDHQFDPQMCHRFIVVSADRKKLSTLDEAEGAYYLRCMGKTAYRSGVHYWETSVHTNPSQNVMIGMD